MRKMGMVEYFSNLLRNIGTINFLTIGIVIMVIWLFISGLRRGFKKGRRNKDSEHDD